MAFFSSSGYIQWHYTNENHIRYILYVLNILSTLICFFGLCTFARLKHLIRSQTQMIKFIKFIEFMCLKSRFKPSLWLSVHVFVVVYFQRFPAVQCISWPFFCLFTEIITSELHTCGKGRSGNSRRNAIFVQLMSA